MLYRTAMTQERKAIIRRVRTSGVSIIEVLVAIAILTIGMLAILILFPAGLVALQTSANSTNADRLGQAELEKASASQVQLVAAIYANDGVTADVNPITFIQSNNDQIGDSNSAPPTASYTTTTSTVMGRGTDVDAFRSMQGEVIRVPSLNTNGLALYTVVADPIEGNTLTVDGTPWQGISGDSVAADADYLDPATLTPGQAKYYIDYTNGKICLSPEPNQSTNGYDEQIAITITDGTGSTTTQTLTVKNAQVGQWVSLNDPTIAGHEGNLPWTKGTDILVRNFAEVGSEASGYGSSGKSNWGNDPYQYQYYLADYPTGVGPAANLGVIAFNPLTANLHGAGAKPLEAILNYRTFDWHIISEDRLIDSTGGTVRLSLTSLLAETAGDELSDNTTKFTGLFTYSGAVSPASGDPDFIVLDMDTGTVLVPGVQSPSGTVTPTTADYVVNYPAGAISFVNSNGEYANDHLRIFYHPENDWAVALATAPLNFSADPSLTDQQASPPTPALSTYILPSGKSTIYFPLVDVGKQVDIRFLYTYTYTDQTTQATVTATTTSDNLYTISALGTSDAGVNLEDSTTQSNAIPSTATNIVPISVKGQSLSAIVIWKQNGIWHNRTISTILPSQARLSTTSLQ
jgi:Tfp pilus assembly protein PilV